MSRQKHILFLTWKDIRHPHAGGAELVMYEYAKGLVGKGYRVTWFASLAPGLAREEDVDGIHIIRRYANHTVWMGAWWWYRTWKKHEQIDLIVDEAGGWPLLSPLYEKYVPIIFFAHHIGDREFDAFPRYIGICARFVYRALFHAYKHVTTVTVSASTKKELVRDFGFSDNRIQVIPNATSIRPIEQIEHCAKTKNFVFVGRLTRIKRPDHAIRAFHAFSKAHGNVSRLHIIGNNQDREYTQSLHRLVRELGLQEQVIFHGYLSPETYQQILETSLCLLVPSEKEGFGLVVIEGNSYGLPSIGYDVAGLRDSIREGENGMLVKDGDFLAMAEKMSLMLDAGSYEILSESSLGHAKSARTWKDNIDAFEEIVASEIPTT